ncbi:MAG: hypothetical protein J6P21_00415 [Clostridia bacterium]|nr:hypothetical protein [Clostridia bacterium]
MSFKVSKRTKQVLASLLITANFANLSNSNVKSMECINNETESKCDNYSDSVCITPELFKDILEVYEQHKNGKIDIIKESNKLFDKINKNYFNSQLIHSFNDTHFNSDNKLVSFAPYVLGRALEAFFDKNQGFKDAFKFCHEKIKNFPFLIYGFDNNQDKSILEKIKKVLKSKGKDLCHYEDQNEFPNYYDGYGRAAGLSSQFRQMLTLGISNISGNYYSDSNFERDLDSENFVEQFGSAFYKKYPNFLNIHPGVSEQEIKIIVVMIHTSLHEIAHHIPRYLGLLEKFDGVQETSYPISTRSKEGIENGYDIITANWVSALSAKIPNGHNMRYVFEELKCNEYEREHLLHYQSSFDPYSHMLSYCTSSRGHTGYGDTNRYEDFAESFAVGSMTNEFPAPTILIKKWNERTQKLVNSYNEFKYQARKYMYDFDEEYKLKKRNLQYLKEVVKNLKI